MNKKDTDMFVIENKELTINALNHVEKALKRALKNQIAVTYCDHEGNDDEKNNPNGALKNIAGIFNKDKNILGMMPHPERMIDPFLSGEDGSLFFKNLIESL